jgi:hypothetical protein
MSQTNNWKSLFLSDIPNGKQPMSSNAQYVFYNELPSSKTAPAVALLREKISKSDRVAIQESIAKDPDNWYVPYHFWFGMSVRNLLRQGGFGEDYWPIWNLDDIYVFLIEEAVKEEVNDGDKF